MKKYSTVIASFMIMAALGGLYAWSIFVEPLKKGTGVSTGFTQIIFGIIIGILPLAMVFGGRIVLKYGPMLTGFLSALLFGGGYAISGIFKANPLSLLLGIGVMSGVGTGFGYIAALSTPVKWFPQRRGLITGIATSGFGAGAIFLSFFVKHMLKSGFPVHKIFLVIGISYGTFLLVMSFLLLEPENFRGKKKDLRKKWSFDFLKNMGFWALFIGMFAGSFSGLIVVGNLKPLAVNLSIGEEASLLAISVLSIGNTLGRILWGHIGDLIGMIRSIKISLIFLGIVIGSFFVVAGDMLFVFLSFVIGLMFGANFVLYAASTSIIFGTERLSEIYPFVSFAYGLGGLLGPPIGGVAYDLTSSYAPAIVISSSVAIIGGIFASALLTGFYNKNKTLDSSCTT